MGTLQPRTFLQRRPVPPLYSRTLKLCCFYQIVPNTASFLLRPHLHHVEPLERKRSRDLGPVAHRRHVQVLAVVLHRVPDARERRRDEVQDRHAPGHERDVVVADEGPRELRRELFGVGQEGARRLGLEEPQVPHALFDLGHRLVGPVRGQEVGRDLGVGGAQEVEEDEQADLVQAVREVGHGHCRLVLPLVGQGPAVLR